jgi:hypothetical protein
MVHAKRKSIIEEQGVLATIKVGDWVDIEEDYSPGLISDGGIGCVYGLHTEAYGETLQARTIALDVHYIIDNRKERGVDIKRCVVIPMPYKTDKVSLRARKKKESTVVHVPPPDKTPLEWLKFGLQSKLHTKAGWLRDALVAHNILKADDKTVLWARVLSDYHCQLACLEGMKDVLGNKFVDPREYKGQRSKDSGGRYVSAKTSKLQGVPTNVYTIPYLMWAYDLSKCTFKRRLKEQKMGVTVKQNIPTKHTGQFVIDCRELARERYNPKFFYCHEQAMLWREPTCDEQRVPEWSKYKYRVGYFGTKFDVCVENNEDLSFYERLAKEHDIRQPFIKDEIMDALMQVNNCLSYRALSKHINNWCSPYTIETWLRSHPTYNVYAKNIKPGLTVQNREKQVLFSKHVRNRWGLPPGRFLWIHSDEKWFHALVPRSNAKACEELGLKRESYSAHHKSHIGKVMAHCTVGYYFDTDVERGGEGFLIGLHRCANFKVPLRDVRHSSKDPVTGKITFAGNAIKHVKGVPYLVDCNVTGSNPGTSTVPCFPLKLLWQHSLMPAIKKLVGPGGPCEGAQVIYQEDNAGPHTEANYTQWMQDEFLNQGWRLELQAPQGIH